jgi:hypothetical protein
VDRLTVLQATCRKLPELKPVTSNQIIQSYDCILAAEKNVYFKSCAFLRVGQFQQN